MAWILEHRDCWPREVMLNEPAEMQARAANGTVIGSVMVPAKTLARVVDIVPGFVVASFGKATGKVPSASTDLAERAAKAMGAAGARAKADAERAAMQAAATPAPEPLPVMKPVFGKAKFDPAKKITAATFATSGHPRVFARKDQRAALEKKIRRTDWAKAIYDDIEKRVTPLVERHEKDPEFIVSRLAMNWEDGKHHTKFSLDNGGKGDIAIREGNAPYPTVICDFGRIGSAPSPSLDGMEPYSSSKIAAQDNGGGTPEAAKGQWASHMNSRVLNSAYDAAIVYYFTGDKKLAKFAADILWTFCLGASCQEQIEPKEEIIRPASPLSRFRFPLSGFRCGRLKNKNAAESPPPRSCFWIESVTARYAPTMSFAAAQTYSRLRREMTSREISAGQTASHS
jgi:hypothetical protein